MSCLPRYSRTGADELRGLTIRSFTAQNPNINFIHALPQYDDKEQVSPARLPHCKGLQKWQSREDASEHQSGVVLDPFAI